MTDNVTEIKPTKGPQDILKQLENEAKESQLREFKQKAQEVLKEKTAAEKIIKQCDAKLQDLIAKFKEGLI